MLVGVQFRFLLIVIFCVDYGTSFNLRQGNTALLYINNLIERMNVQLSTSRGFVRDCLMRKGLFENGNLRIRASYISSIEGVDIRLTCDCLRNEGNLRWRKLEMTGDDIDVQESISSYQVEGPTLVVKEATADLSTYYCTAGNSRDSSFIGGIWTVEVVHLHLFEKMTWRKWRRYSQNSSALFNLGNDQVSIGVDWSSTSPCNRCGVTGKRHKTGYCSVQTSSTAPTPVAPLNLFDSPISCSLLLELSPDFVSSFVLPMEVTKNLRHSLGQPHQLIVGYCKVPCTGYTSMPIGESILKLYREFDMSGDEDELESRAKLPGRSIIWLMKSVLYGVPTGWDYLPEMIALGSLVGLQIWIITLIMKGRDAAK